MQEVADHVWANPAFQAAAAQARQVWLAREIGAAEVGSYVVPDLGRLMQAAAILACSDDPEHRGAAYQVATTVHGLRGDTELPLSRALRVIFARLGNFPAMRTEPAVVAAREDLSVGLITEEMVVAERLTIRLGSQTTVLTEFQHDLWNRLRSGKKVALAAPTSAGKSFVLQNYLVSRFEGVGAATVAYVVPTRALIAQVARDLGVMLSPLEAIGPAIITSPVEPDQALPERAIYVMTQERLQITLAAHPELEPEVVIVDEAHGIAEGSRGVLLQWTVDEMIARRPGAQLLFASPTVRNLDVFGRLFDVPDVEALASSEPTVSQNFLVVEVSNVSTGEISVSSAEPDGRRAFVASKTLGRMLDTKTDRLVRISAALGRTGASIVYANGADEAERIALKLAAEFEDSDATPARERLAQLSRDAVHRSYVLADCVLRGVAFHYSDMPTQLRMAVEDAMRAGDIRFLVCTSTLLQGVNLPARNIFMCRPERGPGQALQGADFWNLAGRAGRLLREFQGNIFLVDYDRWRRFPLAEPRNLVVVPAVEHAVTVGRRQLLGAMSSRVDGRDNPGLDTVVNRLLDEMDRGTLTRTLDRVRASGQQGPEGAEALLTGLVDARRSITLPVEVLRRSPNVSPHRQQRLYEYLRGVMARSPAHARALVPARPRDDRAYRSYRWILKVCHRILRGLSEDSKLHRFHAVMVLRWMRGYSLPRIVGDQLRRHKARNPRAVVRDTLEIIERDVRFQSVRLFGCYVIILQHAFHDAGLHAEAAAIPPLSLYLEVGASDRTAISLIAIGLSRGTATLLARNIRDKEMDTEAARRWLRARDPDALGLNALMADEVRRIQAE